jgi:thiosulfate/3-mercaptopyruvate sulfurtransferase
MSISSWPQHLVSTSWLSENLDNPNVVVLDSSTLLPPKKDFSLYDVVPAIEDFKKGHIPGSQFVDIDGELSTHHPQCHFMLPTPKTFAETMARKGISDDTMVVAYATTSHWWATRLWWTLKVFNHENVAVLDGGFQKWAAENREIHSGIATEKSRGNYTPRAPNLDMVADKQAVLDHLSGENVCLINALRREQHQGTGGVHYGRKGHIAKSVNLPALEHVNDDNTFKKLEDLEDLFKDALNQEEIITYCGGGIAATSVALALDMLGHRNVKVYDASLTEWAQDNELPMEI